MAQLLEGPLDNFLQQLVDSGLASLLDPNPITFTAPNEKGVRPVRRLVREGLERVSLRAPLPRNAFLCGCLDSTEREPIEHLLVGFGVKKGSTTQISRIQHVVGNQNSVALPHELVLDIEGHVARAHANEVILFHNHPPNPLNALFDNLPLASSADRAALMARRYLRPHIALKELGGGGGVRFFLGENGFVREFRMPGVLQLLARLKA